MAKCMKSHQKLTFMPEISFNVMGKKVALISSGNIQSTKRTL